MNAPTAGLNAANSLFAPKKKRVLLVDTSRAKRDLRSETLRRLGADVDCAADISEARCWWRPDLYDLVLINVESSLLLNKFCNDIRRMMPLQAIMFLVGKPAYLALAPSADEMSDDEERDQPDSSDDAEAAPAATSAEISPQRWGILEACRRISAVRSVANARTNAIRNRPEPRRDPSTFSKHTDRTDILAQLGTETPQ